MQQGGDFLSGFASGVLGSWAGSAFQSWKNVGDTGLGLYAMGGLSGGLGALATGGNFWKGMGQGMIITGLNHAAWHEVARLEGKLPNYSGKPMGDGTMGGCVHATWKSILQYLGIAKYKNIEIKPVGSDIDTYAEQLGLDLLTILEDQHDVLINTIKSDQPVALQYQPMGLARQHAVAIQRIYQRGENYRFQIMDPDYGSKRIIRLQDLNNYKFKAIIQ